MPSTTKRTRRVLQKPRNGDTLAGCLLRLHGGKSVDEIAADLKVSRTAVLSWFNGSHTPREDHAAKLEAIFGLSIGTLLQPIADPSKLTLLIDPQKASCPKCRHKFDAV